MSVSVFGKGRSAKRLWLNSFSLSFTSRPSSEIDIVSSPLRIFHPSLPNQCKLSPKSKLSYQLSLVNIMNDFNSKKGNRKSGGKPSTNHQGKATNFALNSAQAEGDDSSSADFFDDDSDDFVPPKTRGAKGAKSTKKGGWKMNSLSQPEPQSPEIRLRN